MEISVRPLTAAEWPDLAALFDEGGDPKSCWCMYWRQRSRDFNSSTVAANRRRLEALTEAGDPPGLVAYADGRAVGWISLGPRTDFERLERSRVIRRVDDRPVWSIVCFAVSSGVRRRGIAKALLAAAVEYARQHGVEAVEGYPVSAGPSAVAPADAYTGTLDMFEAAGFSLVEMTDSVSGGFPRALVRLDLRPADPRS
jgi:GNAT superfamily N-acetyltransferase